MRGVFLLAILLYIGTALGQNKYTMQVVPVDKSEAFFTGKYSYPKHYKDSAQAYKQSFTLLNKLRVNGYLASSIDSISADTLNMTYIYM